MTLTQLRALAAVADSGSVRAAAERLVITQPAVSAALAALQREAGVALLQREGRGIRLTEAGEVLAGYARRVLGLVDEGLAAARGTDHPERGRLRLAAVTTAGEHVLPPFLASFRASYPEVEIGVEVGNRARVRDLLEHREADLVISGRPPGDRFVSLATRPNPLVLVAPVRGAGSEPRRVRKAELAASTWLIREPGSGTRCDGRGSAR